MNAETPVPISPLPDDMVGVHCTVIPDGVRLVDKEDKRLHLRVSVMLMPYVGPKTYVGATTVSLQKWVEKVSEGAQRGIRLFLHKPDGSDAIPVGEYPAQRRWLVDPALTEDPGNPAQSARVRTAAQELWTRVFSGFHEDGPFMGLKQALAADQTTPAADAGNVSVQTVEELQTRIHGVAVAPLQTRFQRSGDLVSRLTEARLNAVQAHLNVTRAARDATATSRPFALDFDENARQVYRNIFADRRNQGGAAAQLDTFGTPVSALDVDPRKVEYTKLLQNIIDAPPAGGARDSVTATRAPVTAASELRADAIAFRDREFHRPPPEDLDPADELAAARRKLAGLEAHPTIAKFLRLIYDVEIAVAPCEWAAHLGAATAEGYMGFISAIFTNDPDAVVPEPTITAFVLREGATAAQSYFQPCPRQDFRHKAAATAEVPLQDGFVRLREPRFSLNTIDGGAAVLGGFSHQQAEDEARLSGEAGSLDLPRLPELRTCGIELRDHAADLDAVANLGRSSIRQQRLAGPKSWPAGVSGPTPPAVFTTFFAEDLVAGYRVDVERTWRKRGQGVEGKSWHTLTACDRLYRGIFDAYRASYPDRDESIAWHPFDIRSEMKDRHFRDRDDGYVAAGGMIENNKPVAVERIFTWTGDPMGVPGEQGPDRIELKPQHDLAVAQEFRMAEEKTRWAATLREGEGYRVVLRARYRNGGGRPFVPDDPDRADYALGDPLNPVAPLDYFRSEETQGPQLLLLPDEPMLDAATDLPGTQDSIMVIRSGGKTTTPAVHRVLVPPNCPFDRAEQQGQFDRTRASRPPGAFRDVRMSREAAAFPPALHRHATRKDVGRGLLFEVVGRHEHRHPYYPDAGARQLGVAFVRDGVNPAGFSDPQGAYEFWARDEAPNDSEPILLRLTGASTLTRGGVIAPALVASRKFDWNGRELDVTLAPAEEAEVWLWCYAEWERVRFSNLFFARACAVLEKTTRMADWTDVTPVPMPIPGVNTPTKIKVVHAVPKPIDPPRFKTLPGVGRDVQVSLLTDPAQWRGTAVKASPRGGNIAFVSGQVDFHRRSTSEVRCEATWLDVSDPRAVRQTERGWVFQPARRTVELCAIKSIPGYVENDENRTLDLGRDELGRPRPQSVQFDRRAHLLALRLVGTSRFTRFFPSDAAAAKLPLGQFEAESAPVTEFTDQRLLEAAPPIDHVWLKATERPPVPEIAKIDVVMSERRLSPAGVWPIVVQKNVPKVRLWLRRDSWFASGQGELLAILCFPHHLVDPVPKDGGELAEARHGHHLDPEELKRSGTLERMRMSDLFLDPPAPPVDALSQIVTAWGTNPTHESGLLPAAILPSSFSGYVGKIPDVSYTFMLPPDASGRPATSVKARVSLITYRPQLDPATGNWYVDIEFEPGPVDTPFVRFCLARYQPQAIDECALSPHLVLDARGMHPSRTVYVAQEKQRIDVRVTGPGYHLRAAFPGVTDEKTQSLTRTPLQTFTLRRRGDSGASAQWIQAFDRAGRPLREKRVAAVPHADGKSWSATFDLGDDSPAGLLLSIHETELNRPLDPANSSDPDLFTLVETPRVFACDIEL